MKIEVNRPGGSPRSPSYVFRKWVAIGAVGGAVLVGIAGALVLGVAMIGGALVGAVIGALVGVVKAAIAAVRR